MSSVRRPSNPLLIPKVFKAFLSTLVDPILVDPSDAFRFPMPDRDTQRTLAVLARTCRAFTVPALSHLWRRLDSLEPLLRFFKSREVTEIGHIRLYALSGAHWGTIKYYASRIEQLEIRADYTAFFAKCDPNEKLFCNLKALKWRPWAKGDTYGLSLICPLLGPQLSVVDISGSPHDTSIFLDACPSLCPGVTDFRVCILHEGQQSSPVYSRAIYGLNNLRSLHLEPSVADEVLEHSLLSPQLQELSTNVTSQQLEKFSPPPSIVPLRNVQKLALKLDTLRKFARLLHYEQCFKELKVRSDAIEDASLIGTIFTGLISGAGEPSLQLLHLCCDNPAPNISSHDSEPFVLSSNTIDLLTFQTNLRELVICLPNAISLDDHELVQLGRCWPMLQLLELCCVLPSSSANLKRITFYGLLSLVQVCPKLYHVALTVDGSRVPGEFKLESRFTRIKELHFPNSQIAWRSRLVAKFLLAHFPSLTSVLKRDSKLFPVVPEWEEVERYVANPAMLECYPDMEMEETPTEIIDDTDTGIAEYTSTEIIHDTDTEMTVDIDVEMES